MTGFRVIGMASGLPPNLVEQIMDAERIPVKQMEAKKNQDEDRLKLVEDLTTKVNQIPNHLRDLINQKGFRNLTLISGDTHVIDGKVDPELAPTGSWNIEVLQLAEAPGAFSNGFPDKDQTKIGTGYLRFNTPSGKKDVYISYDDSTLSDVANVINAANIGVRAEVVQDYSDLGAKFRLLISGLDEEKGVEFPSIYLLDGQQDFYFEQTKTGRNARIKVNGFEMEVPENKVKDLIIPGVTIDLKQAIPGRPIHISVREDYEAIKGKAQDFVKAFNEALQFIQGQAKISKDRSGRERLGPLGGDSLLRTVENNLRRLILTPQVGTNSKIARLSELGIEFNRNGTLDFNEDKFNRQIASQPMEVVKFMRGEEVGTGFIASVQRVVQSLTNSATGPLELRKRGITERIKQADQRIERKEAQLVKREESLRKKFSDLETKMSKLQTQGMAVSGGVIPKLQGQGG